VPHAPRDTWLKWESKYLIEKPRIYWLTEAVCRHHAFWLFATRHSLARMGLGGSLVLYQCNRMVPRRKGCSNEVVTVTSWGHTIEHSVAWEVRIIRMG
jgi:hypothetical protein